jgi:hypothetical protein
MGLLVLAGMAVMAACVAGAAAVSPVRPMASHVKHSRMLRGNMPTGGSIRTTWPA